MQQQQHHNNLYGILFMLLNTAALATLYAAMKHLTKSLGSNQAVFFYKFSLFIIILPWVFKDGLQSIRTGQIKLHVLRGFLSIGGTLAFMYALQFVDMIDVTALGYLEQVLLVIIGMLYFREKVTKSKIFAIFASFFGALIIVYPDIINFKNGWIPVLFQNKNFSDFNYYYLFTLLAVFFWTSNCIIVKLLGKTERTKIQLFYVTLFSCIFCFPTAFFEWKTVEVVGLLLKLPQRMVSFDEIGLKFEHMKFIAIIALSYFAHSISYFKALKYSEISSVVPFEYTKVVFVGILGYYFFAEIPDAYSYVGYILITGAGLILIKSERKRRKHAKKLQQLQEEYEHA
jgi:S-adenosylmethionine uptake transporter